MTNPRCTTGSTHRFRLLATKDGEVWDLTGANVQLYLIKPDEVTILVKSATLIFPAEGIAEYTTLTTDLDVTGAWQRQWKVTQGPLVFWDVRHAFHVAKGA